MEYIRSTHEPSFWENLVKNHPQRATEESIYLGDYWLEKDNQSLPVYKEGYVVADDDSLLHEKYIGVPPDNTVLEHPKKINVDPSKLDPVHNSSAQSTEDHPIKNKNM